LLHLDEDLGQINSQQPNTEDGQAAQQPDRDNEREPSRIVALEDQLFDNQISCRAAARLDTATMPPPK
jgi:hypothetical protein